MKAALVIAVSVAVVAFVALVWHFAALIAALWCVGFILRRNHRVTR